MVKMKQPRLFRVHLRTTGDPPTVEVVSVKLSNVKLENGERAVVVKNVFSQMGSCIFLLDLDKHTLKFVTAAVGEAFDLPCSVEVVTRLDKHEPFVPVERKTVSTMEREAALIAQKCSGKPFIGILVNATQMVVYACNSRGQLGKGIPEPRDAPVDIAPPTDTSQVRSVALMHGTHPVWKLVVHGLLPSITSPDLLNRFTG